MSRDTASVEQIPACCTVDQLCRLLQISRRTYYEQKALGTFPIPEIEPRIGGRSKFSGELIRRYLASELKPVKRSMALKRSA